MGKYGEILLMLALGIVLIFTGLLIKGGYDSYQASKPKVVKFEYEKSKEAVVRLVYKGKTFCSGFVADNSTIFTAAHCLVWAKMQMLDYIQIRKSDNKFIRKFAVIHQIDQRLDRGTLKGDFKNFTKIKYSNQVGFNITAQTAKYPVVSCGYPNGGDLFCSHGKYLGKYFFFFAINNYLIPGMSGGPTMTFNGMAIGINSAVQKNYSIIAPLYNMELLK